jgi:hypothetical protein
MIMVCFEFLLPNYLYYLSYGSEHVGMFIVPISQLLLLLRSHCTRTSTSTSAPVLLGQACSKPQKAATPCCWLHDGF